MRSLAEVCFLQSEYRSRVLDYKYADYVKQDDERKLELLKKKKKREAEGGEDQNDELDDGLLREQLKQEKDKWEESKYSEETLQVANYRMKANKYL